MSNMVVNTNVLALNSHRNMKGIGAMQSKASSRLSSGLKINSAADDAAGLAISEKMRSQIRGLDMASKNAQDGQSLIQTAEGGMQEVDNMLQRVRELVTQAANDTNEHNTAGTGDRQKMQDEIDSLVAEIDSMAGRVEFNKKTVINGSCTNNAAQVTALDAKLTSMAGAYTGVAGTDASLTYAKLTGGTLQDKYDETIGETNNVDFADLTAHADADVKTITAALVQGCITNSLDPAFDKTQSDGTLKAANMPKMDLAQLSGALDAKIAALTEANSSVSTDIDGLKALKGLKEQVDAFAKELEPAINTMTRRNLHDKESGGDTLYFQVGANAGQGMTLNIGSVTSDYLGIGDGKGTTSIDVLKDTGSGELTQTLNKLDTALSYVTTERSKLGAASNRLEYTMKSLDISSENIAAAESRIRDTDMAKEMMNMTKANVLQQASVSMLAQANQAPQSLLQLLG